MLYLSFIYGYYSVDTRLAILSNLINRTNSAALFWLLLGWKSIGKCEIILIAQKYIINNCVGNVDWLCLCFQQRHLWASSKNVTAVIDWFSLGLRLYSTAKEKKSTGKIAYNESTNNGVYWFCKRELDA